MWPARWLRREPSCGCWCGLTSDLRNIADLNAERVAGDLRDPASIEKAVSGCEVVFHVAADYRLWVRDPEQMYRSNVEGTRGLLDAARKQGVRRVVYTSSVATMGFGANGQPGAHLTDEESPVSLADMIGHYKRSKFMAEQVAFEAAKSGSGCGDCESDDARWRAGCEADADGADCARFFEEEVSCVRGDGTESGGCDRVRAGTYAGAGKRAARASGTFWAERI